MAHDLNELAQLVHVRHGDGGRAKRVIQDVAHWVEEGLHGLRLRSRRREEVLKELMLELAHLPYRSFLLRKPDERKGQHP